MVYPSVCACVSLQSFTLHDNLKHHIINIVRALELISEIFHIRHVFSRFYGLTGLKILPKHNQNVLKCSADSYLHFYLFTTTSR